MMNKLWVRLFIIILIDVDHKSEYIPTVTNFASILPNCFYFLRKITALQPSVLNFWGRLVEFCQKFGLLVVTRRLIRILIRINLD